MVQFSGGADIGFLGFPQLYYVGMAQVAFICRVAVYSALGAAIFSSIRRPFESSLIGSVFAFVVAVPVLGMLPNTELPIVPLGLFAAVALARTRRAEPALTMLAAAAGAFAAAATLYKLSSGVLIFGVFAIAVIARRDRWRLLGVLCGAAIAWFALLWLATGNDLTDLPHYVEYSVAIVRGYSSAMSSTTTTGVGWFAGWALGLGGLVAATLVGRRRDHGAWWAMPLAWLIYVWALFKLGFVREDLGHVMVFLSALMAGMFAFVPRQHGRGVAVGLAIVALLAMQSANAGFWTPIGSNVRPVAAVRDFEHQTKHFFVPKWRRSVVKDSRAALYRWDPVSSRALALLHGRTVSVFPADANVVWEYGLKWRPLPVFQNYSAYTSSLDSLNAESLRAADGPQAILRNLEPPIDRRMLADEAPQTTIDMLCLYRSAYQDRYWQVLLRTANRCSPERLIETTVARWNQPITLPPVNVKRAQLMYARIEGTGERGVEAITRLVYRGTPRAVRLGDGNSYRLMSDSADNGVLVFVPAKYDYPPPFQLTAESRDGTWQYPASRTFTIFRRGANNQPNGRLKISVYAMDLHAPIRPLHVVGARGGHP